MQKNGDCDYFEWADKKMIAYEMKVMERLEVLDNRRLADNDRLEKLLETKYNDQYIKLEKLIEKKKLIINMLNFNGSWGCIVLWYVG
jgi:c-di-GMP-binding flagellar brake protein YcgR